MKRYFKKRKEDLRVDNFRVWAKMMNTRRKNLQKASGGKLDDIVNDRVETFVSQARVSRGRAIELADEWGLKLENEEIERLRNIPINSLKDIEAYSQYLLHLYKKLEKRHDVKVYNVRFWIFPLTAVEALIILMIIIFGFLI